MKEISSASMTVVIEMFLLPRPQCIFMGRGMASAHVWHLSHSCYECCIAHPDTSLCFFTQPFSVCYDPIAAGPSWPLLSYVFPCSCLPLRFFLHVPTVFELFLLPALHIRPLDLNLQNKTMFHDDNVSLLLYLLGQIQKTNLGLKIKDSDHSNFIQGIFICPVDKYSLLQINR